MNPIVLKMGRIILGIIFLVIGFLGWLIPILPGWLFIIPGLGLLSKDIPQIRRLHERCKEKLAERRKEKSEKKTIPTAERKMSEKLI